MTDPALRLVTRFVVALAELAHDTANPWRRCNDVARFSGLPMGKLDQVMDKALGAGFVEQHAEDPDLVKLTNYGMAAARGKAPADSRVTPRALN